MGEEGRPQGVWKGGIRATGVKGGEGREERPVPPIMAMGIGSRVIQLRFACKSTRVLGELTWKCSGEIFHLGGEIEGFGERFGILKVGGFCNKFHKILAEAVGRVDRAFLTH